MSDTVHISPCPACDGYGYTEAMSLSWSEAEAEEFSCVFCFGVGYLPSEAAE